MEKLSRRDWQMRKADVSFAIMTVIGIAGLTVDSFDATKSVIIAPNPWITAGTVVLLMAIVGFLVTRLAALDRRGTEEYSFQLISSAALVAVATTLFVGFIWSSDLLLSRWLGTPTTGQMMALLLGSWSVGYFTYRFRGVVA
ncbi:hypothetical protein [Parerythrobacter aestuarii]|uniref:hypothetical protein n=1 Tax=Parerythrobacter aestuarii TaxID=3020909 RepID=UPI0024DE48B4|nr:hypothetical protein [Parerythrobacter aestuarii]